MKRVIPAVLLSLLAGCSEPIQIKFAYADRDRDPQGPEPLLYDLELATGRAFEQVFDDGKRRGLLYVEIVDVDDGAEVLGLALSGHACLRSARSTDDPVVLVHEVGHLLGLDHDGDPCNFMSPGAYGCFYEDKYFTDSQLDRMERSGARLNLCIQGP